MNQNELMRWVGVFVGSITLIIIDVITLVYTYTRVPGWVWVLLVMAATVVNTLWYIAVVNDIREWRENR